MGVKRDFSHEVSAFWVCCKYFCTMLEAGQCFETSNGELLMGVDDAESDEPGTDVYVALDYYFENLHDGRLYFFARAFTGIRAIHGLI